TNIQSLSSHSSIKSVDLHKRGGDPLILCFVDFLNPACAATALSALQDGR
ncbi:hypothetical protein FRX31_023341, partial [Thalictrum thalictroides]